jgi:plastocyanin
MRRLVLLTLLCVAAAGCGGEEPPPPPPAPPPGAAPPGASAKESVTVRMKDIQYVPREVKVARGGTVTWDNTDTPPHTVTKEAGPGKEFDSGTLQPGQKFEQRFSTTGRIEYVCEIHPGQTGTVVVE